MARRCLASYATAAQAKCGLAACRRGRELTTKASCVPRAWSRRLTRFLFRRSVPSVRMSMMPNSTHVCKCEAMNKKSCGVGGGRNCIYRHIVMPPPLKRGRDPNSAQVVVDGVTRFANPATASIRDAHVRLALFFSMNVIFHWCSARQQGSSVWFASAVLIGVKTQ